ncbi:hypothetical protein BBK14_21600 [Parafrankia soli]|uniref:eCIS core domain-containing protein n=1 Tax=Parafrankia soli TaxID=2599596 RepID=A0A1S1PVJ0_9ACTN|nr:DUF4157 domain-containing protein [Parafrankia soli]OHV25730.1 hypothetical protein BBK14_21600 [Parafrankia soli]
MEHETLDGGPIPGMRRRNEVERRPEPRPAEQVLPSMVGNAAFGRLVRDIRAGAVLGGPPGPAAAGSATGRVALLRSALRSQGAGPLDPEIGDVIEARRGAGSPLPEPVRAEMEGHMGVDLSAVRVHTDSAAATLNRAVQAEAFTTGTDVFFAPGRFDPSSSAGRGLLAHELTHVVQQSAGAGGPGGTVSHPDDPAELEAAAVGEHVARQAAPMPDEEEESPIGT